MNRYILPILLSVVGANLFGQQFPEPVLDSTYFWDEDKLRVWEKTISQYDLCGNKIEETSFYLNDKHNLQGQSKSLYSFDSLGNLTEDLVYRWNTVLRKWVPEQRSSFIMNETGHLTEERRDSWDSGSSAWIRVSRITSTYDGSGNLIEQSHDSWDPELNAWTEKDHYVYDTAGRQIERIYTVSPHFYPGFGYLYPYIPPIWRVINSYDTLGKPAEETEYFRHLTSDDWHFYSLRKYEFDSISHLVESIYYRLDPDSSGLLENSRDVYGYDSLGYQTEHTSYSWDTLLSEWRNANYEIDTYDSFGHQIGHAEYRWVTELNYWQGIARYSYNLSSGGQSDRYTTYFWDDYYRRWQVSEYTEYKYDSTGNQTEWIRYGRDWPDYVSREYERAMFDYDVRGNLTAETYDEWDPESGQWQFHYKMAYFWSPPLINDQDFYLNENSADSVIGQIKTGCTQYSRKNITFELKGGDAGNIITIDSLNGNLILLNADSVDYERKAIYTLLVESHLTDSTGIASDVARVKIHVRDINDVVPHLPEHLSYSIVEQCRNGTVVGILNPDDPDGTLSFLILSGNDYDAFTIDSSGALKVQSNEHLDYDTKNIYNLTVRVSDGEYTDEATVTIILLQRTTGVAGSYGNNIKIIPNPFRDYTTIQVSDDVRLNQIELINLSGQVLRTYEKTSVNSVTIKRGNLPSGMYILKIHADRIYLGKLLAE